MGNQNNSGVKTDRIRMGNQYAHIEYLEEQYEEQQEMYLRGNQNPASYQQDTVKITQTTSSRLHKVSRNEEIEQIVIKLQRDLWNKRVELGLSANADPIEILNPKYLAKLLGYSYTSRPSLGYIPSARRGESPIVVGGLIDNSKRIIDIATDIDPHVARFTGAHEIGHAVLHSYLTGLHRDRPLNGASKSRDRIEYEADMFAVHWLMPSKLVANHFLSRFSFITPFELNEKTAFALMRKSYHDVCELLPTRRDFSRFLANAIQFDGRTFMSLSEYFGLNTEPLAIRLEELNLVKI